MGATLDIFKIIYTEEFVKLLKSECNSELVIIENEPNKIEYIKSRMREIREKIRPTKFFHYWTHYGMTDIFSASMRDSFFEYADKQYKIDEKIALEEIDNLWKKREHIGDGCQRESERRALYMVKQIYIDIFTDLIPNVTMYDMLRRVLKLEESKNNTASNVKPSKEWSLEALVKKWFITENCYVLIDRIKARITPTTKGKEVYAIILALQKNKTFKDIDYAELSEVYKLFTGLFGNIGTRRGLSKIKNDYEQGKPVYTDGYIDSLAQLLK